MARKDKLTYLLSGILNLKKKFFGVIGTSCVDLILYLVYSLLYLGYEGEERIDNIISVRH